MKNILKPLRHRLTASQLEMANFLGVHRSKYSMAESGKRSLPPDATLKLVSLVQWANAHLTASLPVNVPKEQVAN